LVGSSDHLGGERKDPIEVGEDEHSRPPDLSALRRWRSAPAAPSAAQHPALLLVHPAPDAGLLVSLNRPLKAVRLDRAQRTHLLCPISLLERRASRPNWEEQLGIYAKACSSITPVHGSSLLVVGERSCGGR
jgi:hypothetical protein